MDWLQTFWTNLQAGQIPQFGLWSYLILALLVLVEGPLATLIGAAAASAGAMRISWVFVASAIGNLTADVLWYTLGYLGKIEWLIRYGGRLGIRRSLLERLRVSIKQHATKILLIAKLTSGLVIPALITAGMLRIKWRRWFPVLVSAEMIWTGSLVLIGFYATEAIKQVQHGLEYLGLAATLLLILAFIWGIRRSISRRSETEYSDVEQRP